MKILIKSLNMVMSYYWIVFSIFKEVHSLWFSSTFYLDFGIETISRQPSITFDFINLSIGLTTFSEFSSSGFSKCSIFNEGFALISNNHGFNLASSKISIPIKWKAFFTFFLDAEKVQSYSNIKKGWILINKIYVRYFI